MKYRIKEYYHEGNKWKEERIPIKPKKKKKKVVWLKISDGLYENQTKLRKRKKK